ncbi:MAG TPA: MBL fold metallo-hydrolase, partial [Bacilli bacterium]|nr:MBL fold metallo-hydrolase [Bacilli bacterium]
MEIIPIASSSLGNCYYISDGSSHLLIECGIRLDKIAKAIPVNLTELSGCLITHEHKDHSLSAEKLLRYCHIFASKGTLDELCIETYKYKQHAIKHNETIRIGTFVIIPFELQHDAKEPLGYLVYSTVTKEKLLFATDTFYIKPKFAGLDYIMIECNYAKDILDKNDTNKKVKNRLYSSHFELENVKEFLKANDLSQCKAIYLMHLSDGNSDEARFKHEIMALTGKPVIVCQKG